MRLASMRRRLKMEDEKLIDCVRKYEFIFNLKHPKYMDAFKKEIAWKEIADQLKQPAVACKQRWQCLRDAYRRALNKRKGKSGQTAKNKKPWKYESEMAFVVPFFTERKTQDCIEITSDDEESDNSHENQAISPNTSQKNYTDFNVNETAAVDDSNFNSNETGLDFVQNKIKTGKKRKVVDTEPFASAIFMAKLLDDQNKLKALRGQDELDRFFLNISDTVKKFSPYLQALAKNKIFMLVSDMELQQLAP